MPCHPPRPSPAPAGRDAALDAALPCAAHKRPGIGWGDGRGATGSKGGGGGVGGDHCCQIAPTCHSRRPPPDSERPTCQ